MAMTAWIPLIRPFQKGDLDGFHDAIFRMFEIILTACEISANMACSFLLVSGFFLLNTVK